MKAHERKVRKARGKFNAQLAERLKALSPTYKLDHLVKERCARCWHLTRLSTTCV